MVEIKVALLKMLRPLMSVGSVRGVDMIMEIGLQFVGSVVDLSSTPG